LRSILARPPFQQHEAVVGLGDANAGLGLNARRARSVLPSPGRRVANGGTPKGNGTGADLARVANLMRAPPFSRQSVGVRRRPAGGYPGWSPRRYPRGNDTWRMRSSSRSGDMDSIGVVLRRRWAYGSSALHVRQRGMPNLPLSQSRRVSAEQSNHVKHSPAICVMFERLEQLLTPRLPRGRPRSSGLRGG
jgi:hypothetical protein